MIAPSVGRVLLYHPHKLDDEIYNGGQPLASIVTHVHSDRLVNLAVFQADGRNLGKTSVRLVQPEDERPGQGHFCEWMPYQVGQAGKTEQLQQQLDAQKAAAP